MNLVTGGTEYRPGALSPSPDVISYLVGQALGGVAREANKAFRVAESVVMGEELPTYAVPLVGRFTGAAQEASAVRNRYYGLIENLHGIKRELKGRARAGESVKDVYADDPLARMAVYGVRMHDRIKRLKRRRRLMVQRNGYTDATKLADEQINALMKRVVDRAKALQEAA